MQEHHFRVGAALALAVLVGACDDGPAEPGRPELSLELNTMMIQVSGSITMDTVVSSYGGFQTVTTGDGEGVHIFAAPRGIPLAIHLPGHPAVGNGTLGRWDPTRDHLREGGVLTVDPLEFMSDAGQSFLGLGRVPSVSFGDRPAVVFGPYVSVGGGVIEIDEIDLPGPRDMTSVKPPGRGHIRGRVRTFVEVDPSLVDPDDTYRPDTLELRIEFRVSLENWRDGRGSLTFTEGELAGTTVPLLVGQGAHWRVGDDPDSWQVIGLAGDIPGTERTIRLWFGTKLSAPGSAAIQGVDPRDVWGVQGRDWPDHFVAVRLDTVFYSSVDGAIELDAYEAYTLTTWGVAVGSGSVRLEHWPDWDEPGTDRMAFRFEFHVPLAYTNQVCYKDSKTCSDRPLGVGPASPGWVARR